MLFTLILVFPIVAGYECRISIDKTGRAKSKCTILPNVNKSIYFPLGSGARDIEVKTPYKDIDFQRLYDGILFNITELLPITISYTIDTYTKKIGDIWIFDIRMVYAENFKLVVVLPEDTEIVMENTTMPDTRFTQNMRNVFVWTKWTDRIHIEYKLKNNYIDHRIEIFSVIFIIGLISSFVTGYFLGYRRIKHKDVRNYILKTLGPLEKQILLELIKADGELTQSAIQNLLNINKYQLSREIDRLERKNLIVKEKNGRINRVRLAKWLK